MISIIIPTLNEEKVIEKTLKSLRKFKGDFEIIISDGKSTDRTIEIAKKYADKVVVYGGEKRQTIAQGKNDGAREARGEFLLFIDADVFIPDITDSLNKALKFFNQDPKLVGLIPLLKVSPTSATWADKIVFGFFGLLYYLMNNILNKGGAGGEFQMVRADVFKKLGGYNEELVVAEDTEFFSRLAKVGHTKIYFSLIIYHSGRRAHKIGWPKLLWQWTENRLSLNFKRFRRSEWEEIR